MGSSKAIITQDQSLDGQVASQSIGAGQSIKQGSSVSISYYKYKKPEVKPDPKPDTDKNPGTDTGKNPGTDTGKDPGTDTGKEPGTDTGKDPEKPDPEKPDPEKPDPEKPTNPQK